MVSVSNNAMMAGIVGLVTVALGLSRNKFLQTNALEMVHRFVHLLTGDRYENMRAAVEQNPWFGKKDGVAVVTGSNAGMVSHVRHVQLEVDSLHTPTGV